ncbi:MAG: HAD family hydrolase [Planctomycetes bacterium]|nr:HAD family hydrolase [Planctomycetota bacterium]
MPLRAAFFDVDGTLARSNIASAYAYLRWTELSWPARIPWIPCFALKAALYLAVDAFDRARFNRLFYRNYRGRRADSAAEMARRCFEGYLKPRLFPDAVAHVQQVRQEGFEVVLVTGSLDFLVEPLARELNVGHVLAARLQVSRGLFTGELEGGPLSDEEKARRVRDFASERGVSLAESQAYGDSIADLPMLEAVGAPHLVNPDAKLRRIGLERSWPILEWWR